MTNNEKCHIRRKESLRQYTKGIANLYHQYLQWRWYLPAKVDELEKPHCNLPAFIDEEEDDPIFTNISCNKKNIYIDNLIQNDDTLTELV